MKNAPYFGYCLEVLHDFPFESVELIYLDPPLNPKSYYNIL